MIQLSSDEEMIEDEKVYAQEEEIAIFPNNDCDEGIFNGILNFRDLQINKW